APGISLLEISRGDVHKASTLADYAASMGIHANDVVAFGDQRNDEQMLRWAGTSYAVRSGNPGLLAEADVVAPACDDDGVAEMTEHLLALRESFGTPRISRHTARARRWHSLRPDLPAGPR